MNKFIVSIVLVAVFLSFFLSCSIKTKEIKVATIDLLGCSKKDTFFIEDALKQKIIFLKTNDSCLVSYLDDVFIGEKIVLYDADFNGRIFVCDSTGSNLKEVRIKGRGVGEIPLIRSIYVDDKLYVGGGPQLNVYDLKDFSFEKKYETMDVQCDNFIVDDSVMISRYNMNFRDMFAELNSFSFKDGSSKKIMQFVESDNDLSRTGYCIGHLAKSSNGHLLFSRKFENIIYQLDTDVIVERYKIRAYDGEQYIVPIEERYLENRSKYSVREFFELDNCLYVNVARLDEKNLSRNELTVFDKALETTTHYSIVWSKKLRSQVQIIQSSENRLIGCLTSLQLDYLKGKARKTLSDSCSTPEDFEWANLILTNVGDELNPVLLVLSEH